MDKLKLYLVMGGVVGILGFNSPEMQAQQLEEIVVTAQRRVQSLQEVPISIETVSGEEIIMQGYRDLEALADMTPGLVIIPQQNETVIAVRGFGTSSDTLTIESTTAMFLDGIHLSRLSQAKTAFMDVNRIELLKGPQPISFGQNAVAGAISITSNAPTPEWEGNVNAELGKNNTVRTGFGVGGPLTDTFGIRLAGKYETTDGYLEDFVGRGKYPGRNDLGGRVILKWAPRDNFDVSLKAEYGRVRGDADGKHVCLTGESLIWGMDGPPNTNSASPTPGGSQSIFLDPPLGTGWATQHLPLPLTGDDCFKSNVSVNNHGPQLDVPDYIHQQRNNIGAIDVRRAAQGWMDDATDPFAKGVFNDISGYEELDSQNYYVDMSYRFDGGVELKSLTAFSGYGRETAEHNFNTVFYENHQIRSYQFKQWSSELRLTSPSEGIDFGPGSLEWMMSLSFQHSDFDIVTGNLRASLATAMRMNSIWEDTTYKNAIVNLTYNFFDDKLSLDLGGRITKVDKESLAIGFGRQWIFNVRPLSQPANLVQITDPSAHSIYLPYDPDAGLWYYSWRRTSNVPVEWRGTHNAIAVGMTAPDFGLDTLGRPVREGPYRDLIDDLEYDPQIVLRYRPTPNHSLFLRYAEAFKTGGFDTGQTTFSATLEDYTFDKESAYSIEAGSKGDLFDGRVRYDATLFRTVFNDLQLESSTPFLDDPFASINAGERVTQGLELGFNFAATDQLRLGLTGVLQESTMTDFPGAGCTVFEFQNADTGPCISAAESIAIRGDTRLQGTIDRTGEPGPYAPEWAFVLSVDYWMPLWENFKLSLNTKGYISDGYFTNSRNFSKIVTYKTHGDLNLNLGFGDIDDVWRVSLWARDIFEATPSYNADQDLLNNGVLATPSSPGNFTTYGLKFVYNYK